METLKVENRKQKGIVTSSVEEVLKHTRNNHLKSTIWKNISVKEEYSFIVPWQML